MAVGSGRIPLNAAITIAGAGTDDKAIQAALQEAYESGKLRGSQLIQARRVIERRRTQGRAVGGKMPSRKPNADVTTSSLVRNYQREVERQKQLVRKAESYVPDKRRSDKHIRYAAFPRDTSRRSRWT